MCMSLSTALCTAFMLGLSCGYTFVNFVVSGQMFCFVIIELAGLWNLEIVTFCRIFLLGFTVHSIWLCDFKIATTCYLKECTDERHMVMKSISQKK